MATTTTTTVTTAAPNNRGNYMNSTDEDGNGNTNLGGSNNNDSKKNESATPFLDELAKSERHAAGNFLIRSFVGSPEEQRSYFDTMNDDAQFPWNRNPKLFGEKLQQHAYLYQQTPKEKQQQSEGLRLLERICVDIETRFDGKISDVYCNRFQDPEHQIEWHSDKYGRHIFVLSLGATRRIEFRPKKQQREIIHAVEPAAGDLYFMPLALNDTHKHRVCPAAAAARPDEPNEDDDNIVTTRLSFVFFFQTPAYAKDYKITTWQKIRGTVEALLE